MKKILGLALMLGSLVACSIASEQVPATKTQATPVQAGWTHLKITGTTLQPDPVEENIRQLEAAGELKLLSVMESFPAQYELTGSAEALKAVQAAALSLAQKDLKALSALEAAEALWKQKRPAHYAYQLQPSCFCPPEYTQPIAIRVLQGKIQQAELVSSQKPLPPERQADAKTIEELFQLIRDAINRPAASVNISYDPQYGFPSTISIDLDRMIADEELYYSVKAFKVASGLKPAQS
ncbi:MAG: hypothetical protein RLZZ215_739 [Pseudomonadota bacterium]|jgi:hypothetical protein